MKLLFDQQGFISRPEQDTLLKEMNLTRRQLRMLMEDGFGAENMSLSPYEAKQLINWFEKNNYCFDVPDTWVTIHANTQDEVEAQLRISYPKQFMKVKWIDKEAGFGKFEILIQEELISLWVKVIPN